MKIGTMSSSYIGRYGLEAGLEKMRNHGYETMDYQAFCNTEAALFSTSEHEFEQRLTAERRAAQTAGIEIFQAHGPWRYPIRDFLPRSALSALKKWPGRSVAALCSAAPIW